MDERNLRLARPACSGVTQERLHQALARQRRTACPTRVRDEPLWWPAGLPCILGREVGIEAAIARPGSDDMQRGHKLSHPSALERPEGFDPSGIPCVDRKS